MIQDANESNPEPSNFTFDSRKRSCTTTTTAMVEIEALCKPEKMFGEDEKVVLFCFGRETLFLMIKS